MSQTRKYRRPRLFEPLTLRGITISNRIMMSPMCQYWAPDSIPGPWHLTHLLSRAVGGVGLVMAEATAVEAAGRITPYCLGLWNDEQKAAFAKIAEALSQAGAVPGIQLAHAGRKASHSRPWEGDAYLPPQDGGWQTVGPGLDPWEPGQPAPRQLTAPEIAHQADNFRAAAKRALDAGFKLVEIHAAHGYLLHSFLSPLTNRRDDEYGGSFENRSRFLKEVVSAVRQVWPEDLPLLVRLSATDWIEGGWTVADSVRLAAELIPLGVDLIDCSSGGITSRLPIKPHAGYQVPLAEQVRKEAPAPTAAVGLITNPEMAEEILANGRADLVALGRTLLWDPYWPHHAAKKLLAEVKLPPQYSRADIFK